MPNKFYLYLLFFLVAGKISAQIATLNLGFEYINSSKFPMGWMTDNSITSKPTSYIDSVVKKDGKYAVRMQSDTLNAENNYLRLEFLNEFTEYNSIVLKGFIKTQNLSSDGYCGFGFGAKDINGHWVQYETLKLHPANSSGWQEYSIKLPFNLIVRKNDSLIIECFSTAIGVVWFDDLHLFLDGIPIKKAPLKKFYKAELDTLFNADSKININAMSSSQTNNLALLGKIWGFLKYHHAKVAAGDFNWDFELFRIMPKVLNALDSLSIDKIFTDWVESLGTIPSGNIGFCQLDSNIKLNPDYSWMESDKLSLMLKDKLKHIKSKSNLEDNYYVKVWEDSAPPDFTHEDEYAKIKTYPDVGFRLLGLFRFWNFIQYYYPYRYAITEEPWNDVIERLIPKFVEAKNAREYRAVILLMLSCAHDSHIILYKDPVGRGNKFKSCAKIQFIDDQAVVSGFPNIERSRESQLKIGDIILEKNGIPIKQLVELMLPYTPASNRTTQLRGIREELLGSNDISINLKILRKDSIKQVTEPTTCHFSFNNPIVIPKSNSNLISKNVGYIFLGNFQEKQLVETFEKFKETKGIVLDLRNYPAEFRLLYELSKYLMPQPGPFVKFSGPTIGCPGKYQFRESLKVGEERTDYYKGKIVILVNENTQSRAEFFAMALKNAPQATVIGSQTAGADGSIANFSLPGGFGTGITGIGIYYPDGKETQRIGIVPDIGVKPTIKGIKEGRDEVLERAIEYIGKN